MFRFFVIFLNFWLVAIVNSALVKTNLGDVLGTKLHSRDGNWYDVFLGVPYAKPPLGDLRFRKPEPVEPWDGVLNATSVHPVCPQMGPSGVIGNENCLYLNIYVPSHFWKRNPKLGKLPVWLFIFGGRRILGSNQPYQYGAQYVMDKPVIFVAVSYRLGALGYLSTEDMTIPGNNGLKDQTMAMRWIRDNIEAFGGDPTNVTLSGGSSGAADSSLHLISSLSRGYFHKCITQSGTLLSFWTVMRPGTARRDAWKFGKLVGCTGSNIKTSEQLLQCLRHVPIDSMIKHTFELTYDYFLPDSLFGAVIEQKYVDGAFLTENPVDALKRSSSIPHLFGFTSDDGSVGAVVVFANPEARKHYSKNLEKLFPEFHGYEHATNADNVTSILKSRYMQNRPLEESFSSLGIMYGLSHTYLGTIETALKYKGPKYFYVFDYKNHPESLRHYLIGSKNIFKYTTGPIHNEELTNMFYYPAVIPPVVKGDDRIVSNQMIDMWYNFIAYGNPNGINGKEIWKPVTTPNLEYLHINLTPTMKSGIFLDDYRFWTEFGNPFIITSKSHSPLWNYS